MTPQPKLRRYIQCHGVLAPVLEGKPPFDGAAEAWFDNMASLERMLGSPGYFAARVDEANFIDLERAVFIVAEEYPIIP